MPQREAHFYINGEFFGLGFADPVKGMDNIATFPIAEKSDFAQNEYMKIYPKIYYVSEKWYIWQDDPTKLTRLEEWLRS